MAHHLRDKVSSAVDVVKGHQIRWLAQSLVHGGFSGVAGVGMAFAEADDTTRAAAPPPPEGGTRGRVFLKGEYP